MPGGSTVLRGVAALAFPLGKVARCGAFALHRDG